MKDWFALAAVSTGRIIASSPFAVSAAMSVSEFPEPKRLSLTFDPGLVLERLILLRLSGLKRKRGQDWLRSLLVQGFLTEGRWIRSQMRGDRKNSAPRGTTVPATHYASWLERAHPVNRPDAEAVPVVVTAPAVTASTSPDSKPFAHLCKVIG